MEFGKVADVDAVDFTLPPDDKITIELFKTLKKHKKKPEVYIGCAKWGRPDWIGQIYPKGTKAADFLKHYTTHFNSIELNALFYQLFPKAMIEKWAGYAGADFRFSPKFSNYITHIKRLKDAEEATDEFLTTISYFGPKLGTSFIQLGDNFLIKNFDTVATYLKKLPRDFDVSIEFRHTDWFKGMASDEMFELMKESGITSVITDTSGRRDVLHMKLTTPKAFIRFMGNGLHRTDYERLNDWVNRLKIWMDEGLETVYFYIHQHDEKHSPILAKHLVEQLNEKCGLHLKPPHLLNQSKDLFA